MSNSLRKAAADFEAHIKTAAASKHIPKKFASQYEAFFKVIKGAARAAEAMKKQSKDAFWDYEDYYEGLEKDFVERGYNEAPGDRPPGMAHVDDFNGTPDGRAAFAAHQLLEGIYHSFQGEGIAYKLDRLADSLRKDLDEMKGL